ncbi:FixH family protein [Muriicola sp.]|uniref:FixH family protein n=1 Tax=Muriicola sp. TaxID=2020856 RepID=UPI00356672B5
MKLNWGTGIVLAFVGFIGFILFFVVRMSLDDRSNHDLVTEDYYKKELVFQQDIDAMKKAKALSYPPRVEKTEAGMLIHFPVNMSRRIEIHVGFARHIQVFAEVNPASIAKG